MEYTFSITYKGADAKYRAKSVIHIAGENMDSIMLQAKQFTEQYPEYKLGACIPGNHVTLPI